MTLQELEDRARLYRRAFKRRYQARVERAREVVKEAFSRIPPTRAYIAWSGGKDSTAMLHLILQIAPDIDVVSQMDDMDWPDKREYMEWIQETWGFNWHVLEPPFSIREYILTHGLDKFCAQTHELTQKAFLDLFVEFRDKHGKELVFLGLRARESQRRAWNRKKRGLLYQHGDGYWIATPIGDWDVWDVWAYFEEHDIPIRECYLRGGPETLRLAWMLPDEVSAALGAVSMLRYRFPELYAKLIKDFSELREF